MKRRILLLALLAAVALGARAWFRERANRAAFPASEAPILLNPARRLIQHPTRTVRAFGLKPGDTVLELGPGPGYFTPDAVAAVSPGGRVVCVDLQPEMLAILRDRMTALGVRVDLVAADATCLPLRDAAFDAAYLVAVLGEVPDQQAAVHELARILRPGGAVSFVETFTDPDYVRLPVMRRMAVAAGLREDRWRRQAIGYTARFTVGANRT
jgi:ubiquinone/menaquinone biosynthesis C-methylase UbiE